MRYLLWTLMLLHATKQQRLSQPSRRPQTQQEPGTSRAWKQQERSAGGILVCTALGALLFALILPTLLPAASAAVGKGGKSGKNARFISEPTAPIDLGTVARDGNLEVTLSAFIKPGDPGSWVQNPPASWNEALITAKNLSGEQMTIVSVSMVTLEGVMIPQSLNVSQLEGPATYSGGSGTARTAGTAAGVAVGRQALSGTLGHVVPGAAIASRLIGRGKAKKAFQDAARIREEFLRRSPFSVVLAASGRASFSRFFQPEQARELVVQYYTSAGVATLSIPLED